DGQAETMPVDTHGHEVPPAHADAARCDPLLRHVAERAIAPAGRMPGDLDGSGVERLLAEDRAQQARLARTVRAEHGDELAGMHRQVQIAPQRSVAERERRATDREDVAHRRTAAVIASTFA